MRRSVGPIILGLMMSLMATAQNDTCHALQDQALENIAAHCAEQESATLCYGHPTTTAVQRSSNAGRGTFQKPGDTIPISEIDWLSVSTEERTWGSARAIFAAYPAASLTDHQVALLALGNVALFLPAPIQTPSPLADVQVTALQGANLRAQANTNADILTLLAPGSPLKAIARNPEASWLYVYAAPDLAGWISQAVVTEAAPDLPPVQADPETPPLWLPGQSFDFLSGIDDAPCEGALESGILLQSPKSTAASRFEINGAQIHLAGTAWLQAQASSGMLIHLLDGSALLQTDAGELSLNSGFQTSIALELNDDNIYQATGAPTDPQAYDYHQLINLPIQLLIYQTRVSLAVYSIVSPAPATGGSPLENLSAADNCTISARQSGANIRSRPDPQAPVVAVMAYRESAEPLARGIGSDRLPWWKLADSIWIRVDATVIGGNCNDLPLILHES